MDASPPPKKSKKKLLFLAITAILLLGGAGVAYLLLADDPGDPLPQSAQVNSQQGAMMALEPFLVNLADVESRRYLKIKMELELDQEKTLKDLEKTIPRLRDAIILLLSSKTYQELSTPEGKRRLKEEILQKLAPMAGGRKIQGVFFTEFVAQ